ncbi:pollen-specific leucine-rich repeat extensin-like protein 1 [Tribolium madens]|uniref:pollen-specific leucine-rich repeat extensin-like protein 1 n=1 Tax=Tribolium madens TaxID=41895 RepID=UPI001CF72C8A|nr:pollen-specific leucine-rich repeat extensin-like protein 1 [Tribolium madens]
MFKIFSIVLLAIAANCQLLRDEERPTRYVLPYSGLTGGEEPEVAEEKNYYKPNRRSERIPATAYQYDDAEDEYYRPQPQSRQKVESDSYSSRYQPSHKDYEEILKNNHLVRLRVAAKKQSQPSQSQPQQPVEQYLKEVNPTTKTTYQRPLNYLRFNSQSALKQQEQNEETPLKQQSYRYLLQPEPQQQKSYQPYQYESQQESIKPVQQKTPHFNLVAYQNALIAQQKLLAAAENNQEENPSKSSIYVSQNVKKAKKQKTTPSRQSNTQQYEYFPQVPPQRATYTPEVPRYPQSLPSRNAYQKSEANFQVEDPLLYPEPKELEYQTQAPTRSSKQRTTRLPRRKPKYQTEETEEYQPGPPSKYQSEDQSFEYQPSSLKYQDEPTYRRPLPRPSKPAKYEEPSEAKEDYLYQPLPKYQQNPSRRPPAPQYAPEPEVRPSRYLSRQQYQDESKQLPQYQAADLAYQPTAEVAVRQVGRGPSVSYRQTYPQYHDRRQQIITPVPKTRHFNSVEYQNDFIAEREEDSYVYITQKMLPSTQYKYHTRQFNTIKLAPVRRHQAEKSGYEVEEASEETVIVPQYQKEQALEDATSTKFRPENIIKKKGLHYPRRKKPTYLNGQMFREEVKKPRYYQLEDLVTQPSSKSTLRYNPNQPFLIVVYDD